MTRRTASVVALGGLLGLTFATWRLSEATAGPVAIAAVSLGKALVVLFVFLELDRSWWVWGALAGLTVAAVLGGGAALLAG